jgi:septum formation protein
VLKSLPVKKDPLILASASPRRREILRTAQLPFVAVPSEIDETQHRGGSALDYAIRLAKLKATKVAQSVERGLIIGADTIVVVDDRILEKPLDEQDAREMLYVLNGRWHQVLTGVCVVQAQSQLQRSGCEVTQVKFASMTEQEIEWYIRTGEPMDKAGGYAIQGHGALLIEKIVGDYLNVVGLPLRLVYRLAGELGVDLKICVTPFSQEEMT